MEDERLAKFVIDSLSKHRSRNEIITALCEQGKLSWSEAEKFMRGVEERNKKLIASRQSPFLIALSTAIFLGGLILLGYSGYELFVYINQPDIVEQALEARSALYRVVGLGTGLLMTIGGIVGLWNTIQSLSK